MLTTLVSNGLVGYTCGQARLSDPRGRACRSNGKGTGRCVYVFVNWMRTGLTFASRRNVTLVARLRQSRCTVLTAGWTLISWFQTGARPRLVNHWAACGSLERNHARGLRPQTPQTTLQLSHATDGNLMVTIQITKHSTRTWKNIMMISVWLFHSF